MEHTNKVIISILRKEFSDYDSNSWHYNSQYRLMDMAIERTINPPLKSFSVTFRHTNTTDTALHEEIVSAESSEEALNAVYRNHNFHIEWHTVKELHF